jgi:Sulfotransferase family
MLADALATKTQPLAPPPPIFVLGSRPFALALVGAMLGGNSAAFAFPQLNLFVSDKLEGVITATIELGEAHLHGLLRSLAYIYGSEQTIISIAMARRWVMRRLSWPTSQVFDELRARVAPRRLIDKSAINSQDTKCLERIRKTLPDAYYVHVVEHPLTAGAVTALAKQGRRDARSRRARARNPPEDQLQWLDAQRLISDALKDVSPDRFAVLRMEYLLADPYAAMSELCARLDLPNDKITAAEMLHPENSPFAGLGPVGANLGDDPAFLRDPNFPPKGILGSAVLPRENKERILPEVAAMAAGYGYD